MEKKLIGLLGLCRKSGNLACGASATENAIKTKKCFLVMVADDAGESTEKKFKNLCDKQKVKLIVYKTKSWLGYAVGFDEKAVIGVKNKDFAEGILKLI